MSWIMDKIKGMFAAKYLKSIGRTILAALSGVLLAMKIPPEVVQTFIEYADPVVAGVLTYLFAQIMSLLDKKKNQPPIEPELPELNELPGRGF